MLVALFLSYTMAIICLKGEEIHKNANGVQVTIICLGPCYIILKLGSMLEYSSLVDGLSAGCKHKSFVAHISCHFLPTPRALALF